jgi:hypothetical protein
MAPDYIDDTLDRFPDLEDEPLFDYEDDWELEGDFDDEYFDFDELIPEPMEDDSVF